MATNDPKKAYNFGWGAILILSIYCIVHTIFSVLATVNHILERAAFMQRYRQELEDKIKMMILSIFYRKGASNGATSAVKPKKKKKKKVAKVEDEVVEEEKFLLAPEE